jgi:large repetitive protein
MGAVPVGCASCGACACVTQAVPNPGPSPVTLTFTGVADAEGYSISVAGENCVGLGFSGAPAVLAGIPAPPLLGSGSRDGSTGSTVTVGWNAPDSNGGCDLVSVTVTARPFTCGANACTVSGCACITVSATSDTTLLVLTGLNAGLSYELTATLDNCYGTSLSSFPTTLPPLAVADAPTITSLVRDTASGTTAAVTLLPPTLNGGCSISVSTVLVKPASCGSSACGAAACVCIEAASTPTDLLNVQLLGLLATEEYAVVAAMVNCVGSSVASNPAYLAAQQPPMDPVIINAWRDTGLGATASVSIAAPLLAAGGCAFTGFSVRAVPAECGYVDCGVTCTCPSASAASAFDPVSADLLELEAGKEYALYAAAASCAGFGLPSAAFTLPAFTVSPPPTITSVVRDFSSGASALVLLTAPPANGKAPRDRASCLLRYYFVLMLRFFT